jgi:hypothetical protein
MESSKIDELEKKWRRAYMAFDKDDRLINHVREKEAWQALCNEKSSWGMCLAPGCREIDAGHTYCTRHRENHE